jgi:hypothetical protein
VIFQLLGLRREDAQVQLTAQVLSGGAELKDAKDVGEFYFW